ncbi:MAG: 4-hydroxyphenylpyruvate dioxygenase [Candidatus Obscuribacterales bacterium]|nr:4-hydroxyphenylpyruvate dioxygenase [Candidatus Obscuribacterales bacterium]
MPGETMERTAQSNALEEIPIEGFDFIEFYVGNALQASYYYNKGFGFDVVAYKGLETGSRDSSSYVLRQKKVQLVLTSGLKPDSEIGRHVLQHGDGVKNMGLRVKDARRAYEIAISRGAESVSPPEEQSDCTGTMVTATIKTYGDTLHTFVERHAYNGAFAPGFTAMDKKSEGTGLLIVDHVVGNVERDRMEHWVKFYEQIFGFYVYQYFDAKDISTQYSALVSKVMANKSGSIKLPLNEPAPGARKSQIQEYLDYYTAPGVQHIAISTADIISTVAKLQERGIEFLKVPQTYYDALPERVGKIDEHIPDLAKLGILVDRESEGYLLQIFTKPVEDRPTLFFEIIQRKGAKGFGKGNFKALFESIEREQQLRGNL